MEPGSSLLLPAWGFSMVGATSAGAGSPHSWLRHRLVFLRSRNSTFSCQRAAHSCPSLYAEGILAVLLAAPMISILLLDYFLLCLTQFRSRTPIFLHPSLPKALWESTQWHLYFSSHPLRLSVFFFYKDPVSALGNFISAGSFRCHSF